MKHKIILGIFVVCLVFSVLLVFAPIKKFCNDESSSCSIVQDSKYKETLGVNNGYLGISVFTILILLTVSHMRNPRKHKKRFLIFGATMCALSAFYFIYLQAIVIKAFCLYCMVIDVGSLVAFGVIVFGKKCRS
jgi:uncharacterized membrane protein